MKVVITGSSKGIGYALAKEFLRHGDQVVISSRSDENLNKAKEDLKKEYPDAEVFSLVCDVTNPDDISKLKDFSLEKMKEIDIWVNNAGTNGFEYDFLVNVSNEVIENVITTNVIGTLYGCKEAIKIMTKQGKGKIFNLAGYGSKGMASPNLAAYGASKSSIPQLNKTLIKETKGTSIGIHLLYPGMVLTDLLMKNANTPESKKIFNILAEKPDTVATYLVPKMRKIKGTGKEIKFASRLEYFWRFMTAGKRKNRFYDEEGNLIQD